MPETLLIILIIAVLLIITAWLIHRTEKDREARLPQPAEPRRPFPQGGSGAFVGIRPDHVDQETMNDIVADFYRAWKKRFLLPEDEPGRSFVICKTARRRLGYRMIATSEGQGYGLLISVLMHPLNPDAKADFDRLFNFCRAHPSLNNPHLMSWQAEANTFLPTRLDSATDGDMDIAYALLLADRQWGSDGQIDYESEALKTIQALAAECVHPSSQHLLLGNWVREDNPEYYHGTRTSDCMPGHLKAFGEVGNKPFWRNVYTRERDLLLKVSDTCSPQTGLLPDFIAQINTAPRPAQPGYLEREEDSHFGFNACRLPLRMGLGYLHSGDPTLLPLLQRMTQWIQSSTSGDPTKIAAGYTLDGKPFAQTSSMAFTAPLGVAALCCPEQQPWLNALWDVISTHPLDKDDYYASTLQLLSLLAVSGNWWDPLKQFNPAQRKEKE